MLGAIWKLTLCDIHEMNMSPCRCKFFRISYNNIKVVVLNHIICSAPDKYSIMKTKNKEIKTFPHVFAIPLKNWFESFFGNIVNWFHENISSLY